MLSSFDPTKRFVLGFEAGLSLDAHDSGCWTGDVVGRGQMIGCNKGITAADLCRWLKRPATSADMAALSDTVQSAIFGAWTWNVVAADSLPAGLDLAVVDHGYLGGAQTSAELLQALLGVLIDGHVGQVTLQAIAQLTPAALLERSQRFAVTELQAGLGLRQDGEIGPVTRAAFLGLDATQALLLAFRAGRVRSYRQMAAFPRYGAGWVTRARSAHKAGLSLAAAASPA